MNLGFSSSPFPVEQINDDKEHDQQHQGFNFGVNHQIISSSSSSSASCHIFFNSTQDHAVFYHPQLMYHRKEDYYSHDGGSSYKVENIDEDGATAANIEVKKVKVKAASSSLETDVSSNASSFNCNTNTPIRVCSDCHTTKTPLWRSGPKGPKSLCNACGIRQRKARRAMAAAAGGSGGGMGADPMKAAKEKIGKSGQLKKRCSKLAAGGGKKMGLEDLLRNLSNKLAFHGVFPQDEKEAAILLMALSSGLVHG